MGKFFYAVRKGRRTGVFTEWYGSDGADEQVKGFKGAVYKKFSTRREAEAFLEGDQETAADRQADPMGADSLDRQADVTGTDSLDRQADPTGADSLDRQAEAGIGAVQLPEVYAFTDGSYNTRTGVYGFGGFLMHGRERVVLQGSGSDPEWAVSRNVSGEVLGAMAAVREAKKRGLRELVIYYDYAGVENWARGIWKANKTSSGEYARFMQDAMKGMQIRFCHVKAHTGIPGNEEADRLAKEAVGLLPGEYVPGEDGKPLADKAKGSAVQAPDRLRAAFSGRQGQRLKRPGTKESAVLVPLLERDGILCMLFEVRGAGIPQAGEICFPGGRMESGETPQETAVRETAEELCLPVSGIEVIAPLFEQTGIGGGEVFSYLGLLHDYGDTRSPGEVAGTFALPLAQLCAMEPLTHDDAMQPVLGEDFPFRLIPRGKDYPFRSVPRRFYFYETPEGVIWGMTAELLHAVLELLKPVL